MSKRYAEEKDEWKKCRHFSVFVTPTNPIHIILKPEFYDKTFFAADVVAVAAPAAVHGIEYERFCPHSASRPLFVAGILSDTAYL